MNITESVARFLAVWLLSAVYWFLVVILYLVTFRSLNDSIITNLAQFWGKLSLKILKIQIEWVSPPPFDEVLPRVIICNHQSSLDLLWGAAICPPKVLAIGKKEVVFIPVLNLIWWAFKFIRVDRKNTAKAIISLKGVSDEIKKNKRSLFLAPEGTRTSNGSILPFKKGGFHIAIEAGCPIYPVVVSGAYELLPKQAVFPKSGVIRIRFLPPVETHSLTLQDLDSCMQRVRTQMMKEYEKISIK